MSRVRKKPKGLKQPKVTPWTTTRDSSLELVAECKALLLVSAQISQVLVNPIVHANFSSAEIAGLEEDATVAFNLLQQYKEALDGIENSLAAVIARGPCKDPEIAFMEVGMAAQHLATNYQDAVYPSVERVLEHATVASNRAATKPVTEDKPAEAAEE